MPFASASTFKVRRHRHQRIPRYQSLVLRVPAGCPRLGATPAVRLVPGNNDHPSNCNYNEMSCTLPPTHIAIQNDGIRLLRNYIPPDRQRRDIQVQGTESITLLIYLINIHSQNRYKLFLRAIRQWRNLKLLKRGGRANDPEGINATKPGQLAVLCPACPNPQWNIPEDELEDGLPSDEYVQHDMRHQFH